MRTKEEVERKLALTNAEIHMAIEKDQQIKFNLLMGWRSALIWVLGGNKKNE